MRCQRIAPLIVGLTLLGCSGLFPPLVGAPEAGMPGAGRHTWPTRAFLFSSQSFKVTVPYKDNELKVPAEIDTGRLLAESLIVVSISGLLFLALGITSKP